jgi:protein-disulfide isomerase
VSATKGSRRALLVWRERLNITALVVVIVTGLTAFAFFVWRWQQPTRVVAIPTPASSPRTPPPRAQPPVPIDLVSIADAHVAGDPNALPIIIEFAEPECPFCARFYEGAYRELRSKYVDAGKVRFAYWHYPLEAIHQRALKAAEAAECAGQQDRFWEMHDLLLEDQKQLDEPSLHARAARLGLDADGFGRCLDGQMTDKVRRLASEAERLLVRGTPTFFFGLVQPDGRVKVVERFSGAHPLARFDAVLTRLLAEAEVDGLR